jgi:hypothetical protein
MNENVINTSPNQNRRFLPDTNVEFYASTTQTNWGKLENVSIELRDKLINTKFYVNDKNELITDSTSNWELLSYFTQDMRLANLTEMDNEYKYCVYYLELGGDFLRCGYPKAFMACINKIATHLELSQSKGGFLRKRMSTMVTENKHEVTENKTGGLFGAKKKE